MEGEYLFGGLTLRSAIALPGLREGAGEASHGLVALNARIGVPPEFDHRHFTWPGRYALELGESGERWQLRSRFDGAWLIGRDGRAIELIAPALPPAIDTLDVLVRRILPRLPVLWGAVTVHAAALADEQGALMLFGPSGAGKSTLSAAIAHFGGWDILSDDMSVLWGGEPATLAPAATGVSVWPASREGLGLPPEHCRELPGYNGKLSYSPPGGVLRTAPAPLRGAVFLNRSAQASEPRLESLSLAEAMAGTVPHILHFNPNGANGVERVHALRLLSSALRPVPAWRLTYPARYHALPEVVAALTGLVSPRGSR